MDYLKTIGINAKKAFEDLKGVKHKKIKSQLKPAKNKTKIPEIVTSNAVPKSGWRATIRKQA